MDQFCPYGTISLAASSVTGRAELTSRNPPAVRVINNGTVVVFVRAGDVTVTATTSDLPILPGAIEVFDFSHSGAQGGMVTHIAGITASGTATVYFTCGAGQ